MILQQSLTARERRGRGLVFDLKPWEGRIYCRYGSRFLIGISQFEFKYLHEGALDAALCADQWGCCGSLANHVSGGPKRPWR
jgi:hypothetical protein